MADRIKRVMVRSFRGVPGELAIELENGRSLVALGDNGTGKSTIADAIEFYFTGQIQFLAREGRAIIQHQSQSQESALVEIQTTGKLGGRATQGESNEAARAAGARETLVLSGRTLAGFVDKSKGEKWKYLFEILGLGSIDQLRLDLQQARNALEGERSQANSKRDAAAAVLRQQCPELSKSSLWSAIQESSRKSGLEAPISLEAALKRDWTAAFGDRTKLVERAAKSQGLIRVLESPPQMPSLAFAKAWNATVIKLEGRDITRNRLMKAAANHLENTPADDKCPVCEQPIKTADLRDQIMRVLETMEASSQALEGARRGLEKLIEGLSATWQHRRDLVRQAASLGIPLAEMPADSKQLLIQCRDLVRQIDLGALEITLASVSEWDKAAVKAAKDSAPPISPQDSEIVNLVLLVSHGKAWLQTVESCEAADRAFKLADKIHRSYEQRLSAYVSEVLASISSRVANIYEYLHPSENMQNITFETWGEKGVELGVDFHGVRQRPPHGVLSESHLNSLGVALFLAMAETFNDELGFLVLDDVVNSFDIEHRGRLAELLASEYQDRQLIVLTHDHIFYERLRRLAPSWRTLEFTSWTYDEGPRLGGYDAGGLLEKARDSLSKNDVVGGATKTRRALEEILQEACQRLAAPLPFRRGFRNDRRELGELFIGLRRALKDNKSLTQDLGHLLTSVEADLQATLNVEAHAATGWASPSEVSDALIRIRRLDETLSTLNA